MTDWSNCYPLWPTDRIAPRPDTTQSISTILYIFFLNRNRGTICPNRPSPYTKSALELINLFISLELIPNKFRWNLVDIMCFQNFEHFQMNFVQSFAPIIHGMHMPNDSSSWSSCTEVCRKVILDVKMYWYSYEKFKVVIFEIIIMKNMKIRISIFKATDFDETLSGPQSTHSKHILFTDDRNLTDRFFIHMRWRFSIIIFSNFTKLIFQKINFENFIGKSIHLYI